MTEQYRMTMLEPSYGRTTVRGLARLTLRFGEWTGITDDLIAEVYAKRPEISVSSLLADRELLVQRLEDGEWVDASFHTRPKRELVQMAMEETARLADERAEKRAQAERDAQATALKEARQQARKANERVRELEKRVKTLESGTT